MLRLLPLALLLVACGGKRKDAVEPALWQTEDGKQQTRLEIAERMLDIGESSSALSLLQLAKRDGVDTPQLDLLLGMALYRENMPAEAEISLEKARSAFKRDARFWQTYCLLYADTQRHDEAIDACTRAVELDASDAPTWNNLGFLLFTVRRDEKAVPALQQAVTLDSNNPRYHRNLGFALFNSGRVDEALAAFTAAGAPADAWYNLGVATERAGDLEGAAVRYRKALELDSTHPRAREALELLDIPSEPVETP